jgi:hypothetical protein
MLGRREGEDAQRRRYRGREESALVSALIEEIGLFGEECSDWEL